MDNKYLDIIGLGIFKALNDKRYPILVNGKISESAIPTSITNSITSILSLIPDAASSENKLADKNFVNSSIATNTATFRGTFDDLATLQATSADINDYAFYVHTDEIGNTAYDRYKHNGITWVFEYTLNNSSFTAEQWSAINSGITTTKVGNYDAHLINYSNPHKVTKSQVGLGNVENVALSSWAGSNKITTLGTITTGVWNGTKITNTYLANSSITIGTTAISLGSTTQSLAGIEKLQLNDANSNLVYDSTTGSWKLTGNLLVTGFISAGAKGNSSSGGGSSTYTQKEWLQIKEMTESASGILASAYAVKEAYNELNTAIETLAGKATNVTFSQTLTSGKQIGTLTIDNIGTILYAPASYAWGEITGKPSFATVATSGKYSDLSGVPTKVSEFTNDAGYLTTHQTVTLASGTNNGTLKLTVGSTTTDNIAVKGLGSAAYTSSSAYAAASHTHTFASLTSKPTTIAGYGITDAKIANGVITLGANTITPLTAHQTIYTLTIQKNGTNVGSYTPNSKAATVNISDVASATTLGNHLKDTTLHLSSDEHTHLTKLLDALDVDDSGDVFVVGGKGFYTSGFISAGKKGTSGGEGSNYTQKEWADIKAMTSAPTENGILASAYSVKEAYDDIKSSVTANSRNITSLAGRVTTLEGRVTTLEGKATAVSFSQTLTSGTKIGAITVDGTTTNIYAPTLASQMGSTAIGGTSSYLYWNGSAWATKALGSNAFTSISKVSQLTNDSGYITGITKAMVEGVLTGNITSHTHSYLPLSGGTMSNTNVVTNLNADLLDGLHKSSIFVSNFSTIQSSKLDTYATRQSGTYTVEYPGYTKTLVTFRSIGSASALELLCEFDNSNLLCRTAVDSNKFTGWKTIAFTNSNVASSSKWANARTITLTGSVTGSVSIDGSANVSLATTTNHTHNYLPLSGGTLTGSVTMQGMNTNLIRNITHTGTDGWARDLITLQVDGVRKFAVSAHGIYTAGASDNGIYYGYIGCNSYLGLNLRISETSLSWGDNPLLHSGNYNSYVPKLDGTGASGTWGINISGNAASSTQSLLLSSTSDAKGALGVYFHRDISAPSKVGNTEGNGAWGHPSDSQDKSYGNASILRIGWDTTYYTDIFTGPNIASGKYGLQWRQIVNGTANDWKMLLDSSNLKYYAPSLTGTGAYGTWGINISGNAATATDASNLGGLPSSRYLMLNIEYLTDNTNADTLTGVSFYINATGNGSGNSNFPTTYGKLFSWGGQYAYTQLYADVLNNGLYFRTKATAFSGEAWKKIAFTDSNVASATKLANSRTIWGQSFDGTGNVSGALTGVTDITASGNVTTTGSIYGQSGVLAKNASGAALTLSGIQGTSYTYAFYNNSDCGAGVRIVSSKSGATPIVFDSNGNVGIGTTSPSYKLHIAGVAYASEGLVSDGYISAAATSTSSDIRLKDNISEISSEMALKWLSMLKPKSWTWNSLAGVKGRSMGFVAQDVEGILPQMVKKQDNGYLSLDYTQLHALEVSALQSHEKRIEELERENKILKEELNKLKLNAN